MIQTADDPYALVRDRVVHQAIVNVIEPLFEAIHP